MPHRLPLTLLMLVSLAACEDTRLQSALAPRGANADLIATLSWVMFIGGGLIFVVVMTLAVLAIVKRPAWLGRHSTIIIGGIAFPVVVLTLLLLYGLRISAATVRQPGPAALRIEVIGERYWWRVHYLDESGQVVLVSANELRLPVNRPVELILRTQDVIHSFWVPSLAGKLDMIPNHINRMRIVATEPGLFRGQCAEFCGEQHARMAFFAVAMEPAAFSAWYAARLRPAAEPLAPLLQRGQTLFLASGCGACHTIRGTPADGLIGPDLTHVGDRVSIGAGIFRNNVGTLAGWIASSQHLKPGNLMPSFDVLEGEELRAIAAYLESLQ